MVLCEEYECNVCYRPYTRSLRIPRVLHCRHTFCAPCLEAMSVPKSGLMTVRCPLCRQMTCVGGGHKLHEALWVNSQLWDQIPDLVIEEDEEDEEDGEKEEQGREELVVEREEDVEDRVREDTEGEEGNAEGASAPAECPVSKHCRPRIRLPSFLKRLSFVRQPQERIMPGSNVEMKSWRRLTTADMI